MSDRTLLTLQRLVSRLEQTAKQSESQDAPWWTAASTLSTVKYAQGLLASLEGMENRAGPSRVMSRHPHDSLPDLHQRLDKLHIDLQKAKDSAKRPDPPPRAPLELRPTLPQMPALNRRASLADVMEETGLLPVETDDLLGDPSPEVAATLQRPPRPSRRTSTQLTNPEDLSSLLSHHREIQDELANDLAGMAKQLKLNTLHFSATLEKDKAVISGLETRVEGNLLGMKKEKGRLGAYSKKGGTTTCFVITSVLMVTLAWSFMFLLIRIS